MKPTTHYLSHPINPLNKKKEEKEKENVKGKNNGERRRCR
jgi:hypothetical protein